MRWIREADPGDAKRDMGLETFRVTLQLRFGAERGEGRHTELFISLLVLLNYLVAVEK